IIWDWTFVRFCHQLESEESRHEDCGLTNVLLAMDPAISAREDGRIEVQWTKRRRVPMMGRSKNARRWATTVCSALDQVHRNQGTSDRLRMAFMSAIRRAAPARAIAETSFATRNASGVGAA